MRRGSRSRNQDCALFSSPASGATPFACGTLVPGEPLFMRFFVTDGAGELNLGWGSWPAGLSGLSIYHQVAVRDMAAICGFSLSNALQSDVPERPLGRVIR